MTSNIDQSPSGYHGCYLRVDLTTSHAERVPIPAQRLREFLGGSGLGVWLLLEEGSAQVAPLAAEAAIVFAFSPLVGSPLTTSAKFAVVGKSPLTQRINDSLASSHFAIAGKKCGCDALMIVGRARVPTVLIIDDGDVRWEPADEIWGMEIPQAEAELHRQLPGDFHLAVIGPAGERLVRFASISHDGRHAGRGGSGAVLGSKNLKAIAVRGTQRATWASPAKLVGLAKRLSKQSFGPATAKYRELGTAANMLTLNRLAVLPTRNFQHGTFRGADALSPEQLAGAREKTQTTCACCTIGCTHIYGLRTAADSQADSGPGNQAGDARDAGQGVRVEYENLYALGPLCGVGDPDAVLMASARCDALGIDTISTGGTIAFAMECVERGLLDAPWLQFGAGDAMLRAIELIARREGLGDDLAEGSRLLALQIGNDSIDFAPQVKGLEIPGYDPRALQLMALGFAVGTRGADHNRSGAYEIDLSEHVDRRHVMPSDVHWAIETEDRAAIMDSAILCKFLRGVFDDFFAELAHILHLVTGWDLTAEELRTTARRIVNAKKQFNISAGWTPAEDTLPTRLLVDKVPEDDRARLTREQLQALTTAYNLAREWTAEGWLR